MSVAMYRALAMSVVFFFFFSSRRRHTRLQGDWSSDVCSSDLVMDIRGNWTRFFQDQTSPTDGLDPTTLGFPSYIAANSEGPMLPNMVITSTSITSGSASTF